jgi:hypothetical protein
MIVPLMAMGMSVGLIQGAVVTVIVPAPVDLDLQGRMPDAETFVQFMLGLGQEGVSGMPPGITRCTVRAVSVVLTAQM